jgi:DNA-binding NtrC family response regulator
MPPGMDGLETFKNILEVRPHQRAILISGYADSDRVRQAQQLGAGAFIKKPYTMESIASAIKNELEKTT